MKNGFDWLNAFDPEVQNFMISLFKEVVTNYEIDGVQGDDVTTNVKTIKSIPLKLRGDFPALFEVRGEIFMPRKVFDEINTEREEIGEAVYHQSEIGFHAFVSPNLIKRTTIFAINLDPAQ